MSGGDPPIVITGGSVTVEFDKNMFDPDPTGGNKHSHKQKQKQIKRVEITGDGINVNQTVTNGQVTVRVIYGDP
ncbi:MAG TPA: hypothetical protein VM934_15200 [Pyrinomonadaceae bacterium]|jgi:hypothetical protein|nr:hypothetical protein [Pyrinomonadaceae bacterium]